jgi:tRNA-Thr(GGU) m(6)t(6)A37 methyltransferase TsaA
MMPMTKDSTCLPIQPIGVARTTDDDETMFLEIDARYADAFLRVAEKQHLSILYWMHELTDQQREILQVHPRGDRSVPLHGVFATRSPMRPNPIGVTRVELFGVEGNRLLVKGLDARDGSPIIDIKSG